MKQIKKTQLFLHFTLPLFHLPFLTKSFVFCFVLFLRRLLRNLWGWMNEFIICHMWTHRYSVRNVSSVSNVHS